ncbi:MAG TPA: hypothetical protein ENJ17_02200 [Gammaproteobacteria bacterium]|nr:hypothetical protein [Gammaproteobacteria bacterium]
MTSKRTLNILAALSWFSGGIVLTLKGSSLLIEAHQLKPEHEWILLALALGLLIGGLKARYLFCRTCRKNLVRIASLREPRLWQVFRPGFLVFLLLMTVTGVTLSTMAQGNHSFLIAVAILDISVATALLGSSGVFWKQGAFDPEVG